ncbi:MAG: phosphoribosylformylglycinamidine synthase subunit PurL [bacterium]|nr:phosphoribosylformylglycinamidine synthase subunit PurL [bacterium]
MPEQTFEFSKLTDKEVKNILEQYKIDLTVEEARRVETEILGRPVTLTEAIGFGIEGSEHTSYRSSKEYLKLFHTAGPHVVVPPGEDAGAVWIDKIDGENYCLVVAHESHNHPSQVVPYEGAATGVGGIVRDVVCMGAKVIAVADPLRFGDIKLNKTKWLTDGVADGIGGYGNPIGVPTLAGDVSYNESFNNNCLVNVMALGIVPMADIIHSRAPKNAEGYNLILVGKPTDNSGFGGTSFASGELAEEDAEANKSAVQEPNSFLERHIMSSTYDLIDTLKNQGLMGEVGFKDLGAGGILCASVELAEAGGYGARVDVEKIHVGMENLPPAVILASETQERFMWVASPRATDVIMKHYNEVWDFPNVSEGAQASIVGTVQTGNYVVYNNGEKIVDAKPEDVTAGLSYNRKLKKKEYQGKEPKFNDVENLEKSIFDVLAHPDIANKKPIYERYDKNVQGLVVIEAGMADAGVMIPLLDEGSKVGVALSVDGNSRYGKISPYWQGANAVVESMRNVAAVGAVPWCLTDCLNYGNPEKPEQMWEFVEGVKGVSEAAKAIHVKGYENAPVPVVSGNVSLYNQSTKGAINPSAIIGCIGRLEDASTAITMDFIQPGSAIFMVGDRKNELGGSVLYDLFGEYGANVPKPDFAQVEKEILFITDVIEQGLVPTCHDIGDGGLITTLAEMCFGGRGELRTGIDINLDAVVGDKLTITQKLFSETGGFVFEVPIENLTKVLEYAQTRDLNIYEIGKIRADEAFVIKSGDEQIINLTIGAIAEVWIDGLRSKLK